MIGRSVLGIAWLTLVAGACYPDRSVNSTTEFASVTTLFDNTASFQTVKKYALVDSVVYVPRDEGKSVPAATQAAILSSVKSNLDKLGWTEVAAPTASNPVDVYMTASVTSSTFVGWVYDYWGYWGWYGGWPPGYGGGYGWYYPGYWYPYSYTTGTVILGLIDTRQQPGASRVPLVWTAGVNGVLASQSTNISIVTAGIDQAFTQSPYLKTGVPQ